jgi:ketosteroid isomerase-like protein
MSHHHYEEVRQKYVEFYVAGNAAGLAQLFTDDSVTFPPDAPIAKKRAGVQAFYEEQFSQLTPSSLSIDPEEETVMGEWGYGGGTYTATVKLKATGATHQFEGRYLNIMKRQSDGGWKIHRHTWNAPTQLAAMAASQR